MAGSDAPKGQSMATATSSKVKGAAPKARLSLGQKIRYGAYALLALLVLWLIFNFSDIKGQAKLGTSYAAHIACSCRYIEGRPLASCYRDFEPGMEMISLADDLENKRVTASVPLLANAVAERRGDFGCLQLNEKEIEALD
jgi:hypothetical protein